MELLEVLQILLFDTQATRCEGLVSAFGGTVGNTDVIDSMN